MRNGFVGFAIAMVLASVATNGCSNGGGSGGTAGTTGSAGTGGGANAGTAGTTGNAGTGGGGGPVTTLSSGTAVNALSPAEVTQLCNDTYAYFGNAIAKATTCKWRGLAYAASSSAPSDAQVQSNCTSKETSCNQTDPWADNPGCNDIPSTCAATVGEYSACISDEAAAFTQTVNGLKTCATLTRADTAALFDVMAAPPPASCMALMNKCADLYPPSPLNTQ
jgi:hypothetical protein